MEDFERILKSYMPFVIIGSMWNMLPDLVNAFSELGKRRLTEKASSYAFRMKSQNGDLGAMASSGVIWSS